MGILKDWRDHAYGLDDRTPEGKQFWLNYFGVEKGIYEQILENPKQVITCTVKELAEKYDTTIELITGFLDGIDDSLKNSNNLDDVDENSTVTIDIDTEKLYMNMVDAMQSGCIRFRSGIRFIPKSSRRSFIKKRSHLIQS